VNTTQARATAEGIIHGYLSHLWETLTLEELEDRFEIDTESAMSVLWEMGRLIEADPEDDPFAYVFVGDPDPTAYLSEARDVCPIRDGAWWCTREDGHPGLHVAGDGEEVCAVWP
jgi:hypothetical protein